MIMSKTLITWPPGSVDGKREAGRLHALYPAVSKAVDGSVLGSETSKDFSLLVVVGHRAEIKSVEVLKSLAQCINLLGIRYVVMANCESAVAKTGGTLSDTNELWAPAQRVANDTGAAVLATTRDLLFDEVGQGKAFAGSADRGLTPVNPPGATLWKEFRKQDPVDEITEGVSHL
jgi:hypothetical protein